MQSDMPVCGENVTSQQFMNVFSYISASRVSAQYTDDISEKRIKHHGLIGEAGYSGYVRHTIGR